MNTVASLPAKLLAEIRRAVADYMESEGCNCCRDTEAHNQHEKRLAELLGVPPYSDGSGFDFRPFRTTPPTPSAGVGDDAERGAFYVCPTCKGPGVVTKETHDAALSGVSAPVGVEWPQGMTLRDHFAAKALPAMYRVFCGDVRAFGATVPEDWEMGIARDAYKLADAMLKAREASND